MPFVAQQQDKCTACGRTVYQTEKTIVEEKEDKKIYHKTCIRCSFERCNKVLSLGELSSVQGKIYCKPHFKQLFAEKGNFEEAFGIEKKAFTVPAPSTSPGTFVPLETGKAYTEKKETSEATAAKIRKFREDGDSERCTSCNRTVYITEKIVVEEKDNKKPYHKSCLRCSFEGCGRLLDLGTYVSQESVIYCKPHFQQLFKTKGNFDESFGKEKQDKWKNQVVVTEKLSFVPATETDQQKASGDKNKTSEATAAKIRQWRQESESDLCSVCSKTVFNAEKLVVEEKNQKKIYHNSCFKCVQCGIKLDLRNYGTHEGKTYCKPHLKELTMANVKPNVVVSNNLSFVPEVKEDKNVQKSETPAHIAAKFKGLGGAERCRQCDKTVYATEKLIVEELKQQHIYHKTCLRCSKCNIQLDASTYGSAQGVIYCKVHLKQVALPEPVKSENAYFVSPLHQNSDYSPQYTTPDSNDNYNNSNNNNNNDVEGSNSNNTSEELFEQQRQQEQEQQQEEEPVEQYTQEPEQERNQYNNNSNNNSNTSSPATSRKQSIINDSEAPGSPTTDDERRKKREEREKQREEEEKRYQEERSNREREREELRKQRESSSTTDDETSDLERRRKEREERRRKADEEAKKEAEDQERRSEERRKRLEALKNQ